MLTKQRTISNCYTRTRYSKEVLVPGYQVIAQTGSCTVFFLTDLLVSYLVVYLLPNQLVKR